MQEAHDGDMGYPIMYVTLQTNLRPEEELAALEDVRRAAAARGIRVVLRRGCILAHVLDAGRCTPDEVMRVLVDAMGGACTRAILQTSTEQLLIWHSGVSLQNTVVSSLSSSLHSSTHFHPLTSELLQ